MAITKETIVGKMEIVQKWNVQVAMDTIIKEDGTEISRSRHRHVLVPYVSKLDGPKWTHTDTDISAEFTEVQAVANAIWTDDIKAEYKTWKEAQGI